MKTRIATVAFAGLLLSVPALAQVPPVNPAAPQGPAAAGTARCAPTNPPNAASGNPTSPTVGQSNESLSDKLAQSDGVMCPPANASPDIRVPAPQTGNTPVIPPPGSPGGDPSIRPK